MNNKLSHQTKLALIIAGALLLAGCSGPNQRAARINEAATPLIKQRSEALQHELGLAKAAIAIAAKGKSPAEENASKARLETYGRLSEEKNQLDSKFSVMFDENAKLAAKIGKWKAGIGIAGLGAGITAATLVAASPANAVWIAAFSGFAGGVAGFNSVLDNNGYSREQIAALETAVAQQYALVSASINLERLFSLANDINTSPERWLEELRTQENGMTQLRALALTLRIPQGKPQAGSGK